MSLRTKRIVLSSAGSLLLFYLIFFPMWTPEMAVRKHLLFEFHPIAAFTGQVEEGSIKNDPRYGDLYVASDVDLSFIYVKKNALGWRVKSSGTGP